MSFAQLFSKTFMPPAADYPLRTGRAEPVGRRDIVWLGVLLLIAFLPRAYVASHLGPVCDDGYFYLAVSEAYERGDLHTALWYLNINIYPVLIAGFDRLGVEPLVAAKAWGVAVATLTLLPLFGWLRRLLDRRVALAACGLYAIHPEFIEVSPEPIRDATFWLLAATSLYLLWRASAERSMWLFLTAGLSVAAAAHTRTEGWLLMLPAVAWPLVRWCECRADRWRLSFGTASAFAMTPLFVVVFNVTVLHDHDRWELGKLEHFRLAARWVMGASAIDTPSAGTIPHVPRAMIGGPVLATAASSQLAQAASKITNNSDDVHREKEGVSSYFRSAVHALEPVPLILMLIGAIGWPHLLLRREHLVLSAICIAVMIGVWVRQATLGEINGRYFLACFFPASGSAGLGTLWVLSRLERVWATFGRQRSAAFAAATIAGLIGTAHVAEAVAADHPSREREAAIGLRLAEQFGPDRRFLVLPHACRVGYYAGGQLPVVALDNTPIETLLTRHHPDIVILEKHYTSVGQCDSMAKRLREIGWLNFDLGGARDCDRFVVLTRPEDVADATPLRLRQRDVR